MKAVVQTKYGSPDGFEFTDVDKPAIKKADDVLVRVHAAALHAGDVFMMRGMPYFTRLVVGFPKPKGYVPGYDVAGVVEAVGRDVTHFKPGDEIYGSVAHTCAEYGGASEGKIEKKPANLTFEQAAAVPTSAIAALQGIRDAAKVKPGQTVLINGASGGVGTFAVQIAKAYGAEVTGVCSTRNVEMVRSIGADHVIDYTQQDFTQGSNRYDVVLDNVANHPLRACRRVLTPMGKHIPNSGHSGMGYILKGAPCVDVRATTRKHVCRHPQARRPRRTQGTHRSREDHAGDRTAHTPWLTSPRRWAISTKATPAAKSSSRWSPVVASTCSSTSIAKRRTEAW